MENEIVPQEISIEKKIENEILVIRSQQVMLDRDLAELYGVETKRLNEQVRRNIERFPKDFCFQLNDTETKELVANCDRLNILKHSSSNPYVFTEQGVAMLASVLKSDIAVAASIVIMRVFVAMRRFLQANAGLFQRLENVEKHQFIADKRIDELFDKMDRYKIEDKQGIFFQGQIFDAYAKFESFIQCAEREIVLIDNYVDFSVLERLTKKQKDVKVTIYTDPKTKLSEQDIRKFNEQCPQLTLKHSTKVHDRFLIIDDNTLYHIGASLKDLGKKCFAFEVLDSAWIKEIIKNL
ncbi:ORF6N domain-containing protein [bacterium]|nr:ORF6N domain-containing protein [bacterium]